MALANSSLSIKALTTVANPSDAEYKYTFWLMKPVSAHDVGGSQSPGVRSCGNNPLRRRDSQEHSSRSPVCRISPVYLEKERVLNRGFFAS